MYDFHLTTSIPEQELREALAVAFHVRTASVCSLATPITETADTAVRFDLRKRLGQHPLSVAVYPVSAGLDQLDELALAKVLSKQLACCCLISDPSPNPYSWIQVCSETALAVWVDIDAFAEDELNIVTGHPSRSE